MKIAIGSDHAGVEFKKEIAEWLVANGHECKDMGPYTEESVDYPDYAHKVAKAVASGEYEQGILLCGTGLGVSISANKVPGIRAALACRPEIRKPLPRQHNNANVLCMSARFTDSATIVTTLEHWFAADLRAEGTSAE